MYGDWADTLAPLAASLVLGAGSAVMVLALIVALAARAVHPDAEGERDE